MNKLREKLDTIIRFKREACKELKKLDENSKEYALLEGKINGYNDAIDLLMDRY